MICSQNDVLVVVDFMSLPQIRRDANSDIIERTQAEDHIFFSVLPSVGVLYTMYPVMGLLQVTGTRTRTWWPP